MDNLSSHHRPGVRGLVESAASICGQSTRRTLVLEHLNPLTETIIGCAFKVPNSFEPGFLEKVYENALAHELRKAGLAVRRQQPVHVIYDGVIVGEFIANLIVVENILELKAVKALDDIHLAQCLNTLKATGRPLCQLLNFRAPRVEVKRVVRTAAG